MHAQLSPLISRIMATVQDHMLGIALGFVDRSEFAARQARDLPVGRCSVGEGLRDRSGGRARI